ncbi:MAG: hypothetical protein IH989_06120 [Planctomycetes bacterium]|nr:hypothetical protein [Planctomycetota bacterium]
MPETNRRGLGFAAAMLVAAVASGWGVETHAAGIGQEDGPATADRVWLDPDGYLPYKLTASGEFPFGIDSMAFDATMFFTGYNESVDIPGAPADAIPLAGLLAGLE